MAEVGILQEGPGTELIEGQIYLKMPQRKSHASTIRYVFRALQAVYGEDFNLSMQLPLPFGSRNEPEPDVLVLRGRAEEYEERDPDPQKDVALVVEVSASSLSFDRRTKSALYASIGVPEYWIVNLPERTLEIRRGPGAEGYAETLALHEGESVAVGGGTVAVSDILPKAA